MKETTTTITTKKAQDDNGPKETTTTTTNKKKKKSKAVAKIVTETVHPRLTRLPARTACCIATVVIIDNIVFVTLVTLYNWADVNVKLAVMDAEWTTNGAYRAQFRSPTHLCNSYGPMLQEDGQVFYTQPCLLTGLTCELDYGDEFCPDEAFPFVCSNDIPICGTLGSFASVVYVDGASFPVAFGSAMGYLIYVQAVVLIICLVVYYLCCGQQRGARVSDLKHDVRAVALGLVQV